MGARLYTYRALESTLTYLNHIYIVVHTLHFAIYRYYYCITSIKPYINLFVGTNCNYIQFSRRLTLSLLQLVIRYNPPI